MKNIEEFSNLIDLVTTYNTEEKCSLYIAQKRWGDKPVCPHCGNDEKVYCFKGGIYFKCAACLKKFTVRVGTIFEDSKIPLTKWFAAIYMIACRSKSVSSVQLAKDLKITQKSAWHVLHRLRYGMSNPDYKKPLENICEADESYLGGEEKNRHESKRNPDGMGGNIGRSQNDKAAVFGVVERNQYELVSRDHKIIKDKRVNEKVVLKSSTVIAKHVPNTKKDVLQPIIIANVKEFSRVITDEWYAYNGLDKQSYMHATIKHALKQYVVGDIHTNTIENFWSVLKRNIFGIYHFTSRKHLQAYLEEVAHRFNNRAMLPYQKFDLLLKQSDIGPLMYKDLIR